MKMSSDINYVRCDDCAKHGTKECEWFEKSYLHGTSKILACSDGVEKIHALNDVKPAWIAAWSRIGELAVAIHQQYEVRNGDANLVKQYAEEITWQCSIIDAMKEDDE